jgi:hypothetical protein
LEDKFLHTGLAQKRQPFFYGQSTREFMRGTKKESRIARTKTDLQENLKNIDGGMRNLRQRHERGCAIHAMSLRTLLHHSPNGKSKDQVVIAAENSPAGS